MGLFATALACLALSPGCGGPAVEGPPAVARFALSYERSGGLAGTPRSLRIRPGRQAIAKGVGVPGGSVDSAAFRVGAKRIKSLRTALERADFQALPPAAPNPGSCADCYLYAIRYRGHEVAFNEIDLPKGLAPVVAQTEALIAAHLPFH